MTLGVDGMRRIGHYTVERELGAGGMGTVYLARSRGGRAVAVKVVRPELATDPHFRDRFRAEIAAARKVGGFHTAPVVDADPDAETPWLATAYVPGPTLSGLLAAEGPMDEQRLRLLGAALAEALQAIHACGLVHRDLKPGNIIMAEDGPRVLDFGIARAVASTRLTVTGAAFGTPGFLAPEQAQGREVGGAADVFALGAVLVAAAGGSAFGTGTAMELMYRCVWEPADLSSLPQGLRPVVEACLAKDPAQRPSPDQLLDLFASPTAAPYVPTAVVTPVQGAEAKASMASVPPFRREPSTWGADWIGDDVAFVAEDHRSGIVIGGRGVTIDFEGQRVRLAWGMIRTVEYEADSATWLKISVSCRFGAAYHCRVDALRTSRLHDWIRELEPVLDRYLHARGDRATAEE
ncbi:serine/threonine-protein kinase [Kitasatospora sp. NPDC098652]|uniref:serine/threonine-protein kinase n=1 Tax=Kitasatospora sp. NPDC098652 TaxID=3364095 RepID=UPI003820EAB7